MFAQNDRISHRQLMRQIVLSLIAPFFLCLAGFREIKGMGGVLGIIIAVILLGFYVIFLVRLSPAFEYLPKYMGNIQSLVIVLIYLIYILFTAAYLLDFASRLCGQWLLSGIHQWFLKAAIVIICAAGSHKGMEKRARMAEVSFWIVAGGLMLLLILAVTQGELFSAEEFWKDSVDTSQVVLSAYEVLCGFLPLVLLPFMFQRVAKSSGSYRAVFGAVAILGALLAAVIILLPMALGWERMNLERIPVLPLLTGTNLPGDVLARFDVIWICLLIYAMFYSLGSLLYYGNHILYSISLPCNHWLLAALVFLISLNPFFGYEINLYYSKAVLKIAAPVLVLLTVYIYIWYRRKKM